MKSIYFLSLILVTSIYCADDLPADVKKGLEAMENPEISYALFEYAKKYIKTYIGTDVTFEHLNDYTRPKSFYEDQIYTSKRLKYYSYFAAFGYCFPEDIEKGKCCSNVFNKNKDVESANGWTLIDYGRSSDVDTHSIYTHNKNTYAIFRSDIFRKVVITFPGTKDQIIQLGSELINSILVTPTMYSFSGNIKIGKYFEARASALINFIFTQENIAKMKLSNGYQVIFTGHSLGGAMAAASFFFAVDRGFITRKINKPVIITYGQPRTGNLEFSLAVNNNAEVIYRNVNTMDIVTQVPLYKDGYRHIGQEISIDGDKSYYTVVPAIQPYDVNTVIDEQKYDIITLMKYLINNIDRHTWYFTKCLGGLCSP